MAGYRFESGSGVFLLFENEHMAFTFIQKITF